MCVYKHTVHMFCHKGFWPLSFVQNAHASPSEPGGICLQIVRNTTPSSYQLLIGRPKRSNVRLERGVVQGEFQSRDNQVLTMEWLPRVLGFTGLAAPAWEMLRGVQSRCRSSTKSCFRLLIVLWDACMIHFLADLFLAWHSHISVVGFFRCFVLELGRNSFRRTHFVCTKVVVSFKYTYCTITINSVRGETCDGVAEIWPWRWTGDMIGLLSKQRFGHLRQVVVPHHWFFNWSPIYT